MPYFLAITTNMRFLLLSFLTLGLTCCLSCQRSVQNMDQQEMEETIEMPIDYKPFASENEVIKGLSFVAPPNEFSDQAMPIIKGVDCDWISVIPYGFMNKGEPNVQFGTNAAWQWWGETIEGVSETIARAKAQDINVMLKPHVWIHGKWVGDVYFESEDEWLIWEESNRAYVMAFAEIAQELEVPMYCIGTEWKRTVVDREAYWRKLISEVREIYDGELTYAANWDEYDFVPFWDALDFIGVNAYFPLLNEAKPTTHDLVTAWEPIKKTLSHFADEKQKRMIFTEFGYMSVENCAYQTWVLEEDRSILTYNEECQYNAINALYSTFWNEQFWAGGFLWKWYPDDYAGDRMRVDYTPQGKTAQQLLKDWFSIN